MKALAVIGGLIVGLAAIYGGVRGYIWLYSDTAPRFEAAQRQVFVNTPSYVNGKIEYLTRLKGEYERAETKAGKVSFREQILAEAASVDPNSLPTHLRVFIDTLAIGGAEKN